MISFPNCKINLGLHVVQLRTDGYHDLETVYYPVTLHDALEVVEAPADSKRNTIHVSGHNNLTLNEDNLCIKACVMLQKDFPTLPFLQMHLHKVVPIGGGLGGGSADGAFTLAMLNLKFNLGITREKMLNYALQLGSDCPFFIINQPCLASGRGEILEKITIDLKSYRLFLVNPGIHISTKEAFKGIRPANGRQFIRDIIQLPVEKWKDFLTNDFETLIMKMHPVLKNIKQKMYDAGALYASMSGTGATIYGIFHNDMTPTFQFPQDYFVHDA